MAPEDRITIWASGVAFAACIFGLITVWMVVA